MIAYIINGKITKGPNDAMKNKISPNVKKLLLSSITPDITNKIPINPKSIGKICENNTNPEFAILSLNF